MVSPKTPAPLFSYQTIKGVDKYDVNFVCYSLGPLVNKVKEYQVEGIVETLCVNMLSDTEQLRDISSIGLKTVISELPLGSNTLAANVCKKITGRLSSAIEKVCSALSQ